MISQRVQAVAVTLFVLVIASVVVVLLTRIDREAPTAAGSPPDRGNDLESAGEAPVGVVSILSGAGDIVLRVQAGSCSEPGGPRLELSENTGRTFRPIRVPQVDDGSGVSLTTPSVRAVVHAEATSPVKLTVGAADDDCTVHPYTTTDGGGTWQQEDGPLREWHLDPATGDVVWQTNKYFVTAKCTLTGKDGRLYIGGYNPAREDTKDRYVWCLDAADGSLVWQSDPITSALNVVTVGDQFIFSNALRGRGNVFDRKTGKVVGGVDHNYACCRFTMSGSYILGANMDMIDLAAGGKLVSTGPAIDSRECLGAVVSNGRIFYTSQASGFVVSQTYGPASKELPAVWDRKGERGASAP